jgi:hypothetical protein
MKVPVILGLSALLSSASAQYYRGFNLGANLPSGACRAEADWENAFNTIKSFPGNFTSARLYASSDCNTLANAVPAAIKTGMTILVGVWTEDNTHYEAEKQALLTAIQQHGSDWILAVSVGSEDLYRGDVRIPTTSPIQSRSLLVMPRSKLYLLWVAHVRTPTVVESTMSSFLCCNGVCTFFANFGEQTDASTLASQINDVRGMLWYVPFCLTV